MNAIKIDVWSDIACPWCYIGKRRLEEGLAQFAERPEAVPVHVEYHSFQLAPDTPVDFDGSEVDFLVGHKRVPEANAREMLANVTRIARTVGLEYDFEALRHTNTLKAHQLLHYAKAHGRQWETKERLLRAYFVEGRHLGHDDELAALAAAVGLDGADVARSLSEGEYVDAVRADERLAARHGIAAVPFFVFNGRHGISGAQRPETFVDALVQASEARARTA